MNTATEAARIVAILDRPSGIAGLRIAAREHHACPWCKAEAGTYCRGDHDSGWSALPHDARLDLALAEYVDVRVRRHRKIGYNAGLVKAARAALDAIEGAKR